LIVDPARICIIFSVLYYQGIFFKNSRNPIYLLDNLITAINKKVEIITCTKSFFAIMSVSKNECTGNTHLIKIVIFLFKDFPTYFSSFYQNVQVWLLKRELNKTSALITMNTTLCHFYRIFVFNKLCLSSGCWVACKESNFSSWLI